MKKFITSIFAMAFIATSLQAADIVVDSYGTGNYFTIPEALAAANPGDRILVIPHASSYTGDLYIEESIELLSQVEGQRFNYQGEVYINVSNALPANSSITIQSMHNLSGSISSYYGGTGTRNRVNIVNCKLNLGNIVFDQIRWDMRIQNDSLMNGFITMRFGRVTGCYVNTSAHNTNSITVNTDVATDDYVYIVGNKIICSNFANTSPTFNGVFWNSTTQYFYISNNYITSSNMYPRMIYCQASKTGTAKDNWILNNTFNKTGNWSYMVQIASALSNVRINNNLFANYTLGIYGTSLLLVTASFNHFHTTFTLPNALTLILDNGTNTISAQTIDTEGMPNVGTSAINGGDDNESYQDLDGTRNDAGCFGGSYSRENFLASSSGARTAFVIAPRRVIVGQPIDIFAEGFDY